MLVTVVRPQILLGATAHGILDGRVDAARAGLAGEIAAYAAHVDLESGAPRQPARDGHEHAPAA